MVGLLVNALVQILSRYANIRLLKSVYAGFAAGLISLVLLEACIYFISSTAGIEFLLILLSNIIIYATLSFCYFNLITLGETARRIRIMVELSESKTGLTLEEIIKRYNARMIVDLRLDRLLGNGEITLRGTRYFIGNSKMFQIGRIYTLAKLILFGKRSEFD